MVSPYVAAIVAVVMLTTILMFFIRYGFSAVGRARDADQGSLAQFIALVLATMNVGRLVTQRSLTRPLLARYGLQFGVLALPVVVTTLMAGIVGAGWGWGRWDWSSG